MKKILAILALPLLASCANLDSAQPQAVEDNGKFVLTAYWNSTSRTSIADEYGKVVWNSEDSIAVFTPTMLSPIKMVTTEGGETAQFVSDTEPDGNPYFALYPYSDEASFEGSIISTVIPTVQKAVANTPDPLSFIAAGKSDTPNMTFKPVCGGIRFTVKSEDITRVVFSGNAGEPLAETISVDLLGDAPYVCETDLSEETVELQSDTPLQSGTLYYLTFLPQDFERGFTMEFYNGDTKVATSICHRPVTIRSSVYSTIRNADDPEAVSGILTGEDLSVDGTKTANCYIVSSPGYYKFPVRIGLSTESVQDIASVNVIWETDNSSQKPDIGSLISEVAYKGEYIYFRAGNPSDELVEGNALITARNTDGIILWSWHIWLCTDIVADAPKFMDRNLGALDSKGASSYGLLYQWGRKDPFMGIAADDSGKSMAYTSYMDQKQSNSVYGTVRYVINNPTFFLTSTSDWLNQQDDSLWGETKTDYDPCPYGWRVPSSADFAGMGDDVQTSFPACGYREKSTGELQTSLSYAWYWTSSCNGKMSKAFYVDCQPNGNSEIKDAHRAQACAIRCVKE